MPDSTHTHYFKDYLRGIARYQRRETLERLATITNWAALAQRKVEDRGTQLLKALDPDTLKALADGEIDAPQAIQHILNETR